jgi:hypothetical protein
MSALIVVELKHLLGYFDLKSNHYPLNFLKSDQGLAIKKRL